MLADRLLGIVCMTGSAILFIYSIAFPFQAAIYPSAVLVAIFLLGLSLVVKPQSKTMVTCDHMWDRVVENKRVPLIILTVFAFIVLIDPLGFYVALFLFMLASQLVMGVRKPVSLLIVSVFMTLLIYGIFSVGLGLNIPMGILER